MKKVGFILLLSIVSYCALAQSQTANLNQTGNQNSAIIGQIGNNQTAAVDQTGNGNGAMLLQDGVGSAGSIYQSGNKSYAYLQQSGLSPIGQIQQYGGNSNFAAIAQAAQSSVEIVQNGSYNLVAGASTSALAFQGCTPPQISYYRSSFNRSTLAIPSPFEAVDVAPNGIFTVSQTGYGNTFLTSEPIVGEEHIAQNGQANLIILAKDKGYANLVQEGMLNYIWLKMTNATSAEIYQYGAANLAALDLSNGSAYIYQKGAGNKIGYFEGMICKSCPSDVATFKGDQLTVNQVGDFNKLSLKSTSANSNVTVSQYGCDNWASITQIGGYVQNGGGNNHHGEGSH